MTVGYETAVILISMALFGGYCLAEELWRICRHKPQTSPVTILLIVQNAEYEIEQLVRTAARSLAGGELIVIDIASNDMTRPILARLADEHTAMHIIHRSADYCAAADGIAAARGQLICICDTVHRMTTEECLARLERLAIT